MINPILLHLSALHFYTFLVNDGFDDIFAVFFVRAHVSYLFFKQKDLLTDGYNEINFPLCIALE